MKESPVDDAILQRYQVAAAKRLTDLQAGQNGIQERSRADDADFLMSVNPDRYAHQSAPRVVQGPQGTLSTSVDTEVHSLPLPEEGKANSQPR